MLEGRLIPRDGGENQGFVFGTLALQTLPTPTLPYPPQPPLGVDGGAAAPPLFGLVWAVRVRQHKFCTLIAPPRIMIHEVPEVLFYYFVFSREKAGSPIGI